MIHLFGGIHEVYFPFVLKEPKLFLVAILSGITGTTIFQFLNAGLTMPVSPGSIILMHDIHETSVDAVPRVIEYLTNEGYQLVTISQLP